ncbi:MAG: AMP-binding protein, partial [Candidatus Omnitrophota bacterium]
MNIVELIFSENADHDGVALMEGLRKVSYVELFESVRSLAGQFRALGIVKGTYVVLCWRGGIDYVITSLAVLLCGGVVVPVSETASDSEIHDVVKMSGAEIFIGVRAVACVVPVPFSSDVVARSLCLFRVSTQVRRDERIKAIDAAFVRFSSGTTGASKGVLLSHPAIVERTDAADQVLKMTRDDRVIWVLNMSF